LRTVVPYANSPIMTASSKIADTGVGSDSPDDFICAGTKFFWAGSPAFCAGAVSCSGFVLFCHQPDSNIFGPESTPPPRRAIEKYAAHLSDGWYRHESFRQSITDLGGTWKGVLTLALLVFAMLVPFVGYGELRRVLGAGQLERIFFKTSPFAGEPGKS
jgi:hypothetical protein